MGGWPVLHPTPLLKVRNCRPPFFAIASWLPSASYPGSIVACTYIRALRNDKMSLIGSVTYVGGSLTSVCHQKKWSPWAYAQCIKYIVPVQWMNAWKMSDVRLFHALMCSFACPSPHVHAKITKLRPPFFAALSSDCQCNQEG